MTGLKLNILSEYVPKSAAVLKLTETVTVSFSSSFIYGNIISRFYPPNIYCVVNALFK